MSSQSLVDCSLLKNNMTKWAGDGHQRLVDGQALLCTTAATLSSNELRSYNPSDWWFIYPVCQIQKFVLQLLSCNPNADSSEADVSWTSESLLDIQSVLYPNGTLIVKGQSADPIFQSFYNLAANATADQQNSVAYIGSIVRVIATPILIAILLFAFYCASKDFFSRSSRPSFSNRRKSISTHSQAGSLTASLLADSDQGDREAATEAGLLQGGDNHETFGSNQSSNP